MRHRLTSPTTLMIIIIALGFGLRLFHLDTQSFWYDEAFSAGAAQGTLAQILGNEFRDVHPQLYYLILHYWLAMGEGDFSIRLLSAFLGVAGIAGIYSLGKALFDHTVGLLAASIAAFAPYKVFYSQEARMYSLLFFLISMVLLSYVRMLQADSRRWWAAYTVSAALSLYVHYFSVLLLLSLHLHFVIDRAKRTQWWQRLAISDALIILALVPQLTIFLGQAQHVTGGYWIARPSLAQLFSAPYAFALSRLVSEALVPFAFALILFLFIVTHLQIARALAKRDRDSTELTLILCSFWTPLLLAFIVSQWQPVYLERTLMVVVPTFYLLLSWGATQTRERYLNLALLLFLALFALNALHNWYFDPHFGKPPFRTAAQFLQARAETDEPILHSSDGGFVIFLHYTPDLGHYLIKGDPTPQLPSGTYRLHGGEMIAKEELSARRFWLVVALDNSIEFQRNLAEWFDGRHKLVESHDFGGINLLYYDDTGTGSGR